MTASTHYMQLMLKLIVLYCPLVESSQSITRPGARPLGNQIPAQLLWWWRPTVNSPVCLGERTARGNQRTTHSSRLHYWIHSCKTLQLIHYVYQYIYIKKNVYARFKNLGSGRYFTVFEISLFMYLFKNYSNAFKNDNYSCSSSLQCHMIILIYIWCSSNIVVLLNIFAEDL